MTVVFLNAWGVFLKGGLMMWPLLLLSIISISIAVEKFLQTQGAQKDLDRVKDDVFKEIRVGHLKEALKACEEDKGHLGRILKAGILKYGQPREVLLAVMEEAAVWEIHLLKKRLDLLALITNAGPLLGVLGTVSALSVVFHAVQVRSNLLNPLSLGDMSSGIWQALLATTGGVVVGIISLACHGFCAFRVNDLIARIERSVQGAAALMQGMAELETGHEEG